MNLSKLGFAVGLLGVAIGCVAACNTGVRYDDVMVAPQPDPSAAASTTEPTSDPTSATASAAPSASPAPDTSATPAAATKYAVKGRDVDADKGKNLVQWNPDQSVQKASYSHYRFKYAEYVAAVGEANLKSDVELEAECTEAIEAKSKPGDPTSPAPVGGFTHRTYDCKVVRATVKK